MKQVVIKNLPEALKLIKEMKLASAREWSGTYREAARSAIASVLREEMETLIGHRLSWASQKGIRDRRNGSYPRHVLTELGRRAAVNPPDPALQPEGCNYRLRPTHSRSG